MRKRLVLVLIFTSSVGLARNAAFDRYLDDFSAAWVREDPELATQQQYFTGAEQDALDRRLTPVNQAYRAWQVATARRALQELSKFPNASLDEDEQVSNAMLRWQLDTLVRNDAFADDDFVFQQFSGLQVSLIDFLSQTHPIRNRRDVENYLARLDAVAGVVDDGVAEARRRAAEGYVPPAFILRATLGQLDRFLAPPPRDNILVSSLADRMPAARELSHGARSEFVAKAAAIVATQVIPAFQRARRLLQEQLPSATEDAGLWRFRNGAAAYQAALQELTTTNLTPTEVHDLGLREVARIEVEMDQLLRKLGYTDGSISVRMARLNADVQPPPQPDPRPMLLQRYTDILADAERRAAEVFDLRPKAPIVVKRVPPYSERNSAAHYMDPAPDGSRPGIFWAPLPGPTYDILEMRTTVYHEGVPGHHFQIALQQENRALPRFRRKVVFGFISAHGEGWALYAERLAVELGWYDGDQRGHLGQLSDELLRARRLVVDTGLHAQRWTRQQAIDYGIPASEVERYVVWPGQACSYKIGQLRILALRDKAQQALGEKFSLKHFHNLVLRTGNVPLDVLEQAIDRWIAAGGQ